MNSMTNKKDPTNSGQQHGHNPAETVGGRIKEMAANVGDKVDHAAESVGAGMQSLGEKVREKGPEAGVLGAAAGKVADALEGAGNYLEDKKLSGMAEDVTNLIRRHPVPALLIGIGIGFLLSRLTRG